MSSTNNRFRINLPDGWEDQTAYTFMGPEVKGQRHMLNLVIDRNLADTDLKEFALDRIQPVRDAMPNVETLTEEERTLATGVPVYEWVYKMVPAPGQAIFHKHVYLIVGKQGYTFSAVFSKQSFKTIGIEVDRMIESFFPEG